MSDSVRSAVSRRRFLIYSTAIFGAGALGGVAGSLYWASNSTSFLTYLKGKQNAALSALLRQVLPLQGHTIELSFGDSIQRLVAAGVISPEKFRLIYAKRGGIPPWVEQLFTQTSKERITLSFQAAPYLLNLLWPLGVATKTRFNERSPIRGKQVGQYASTGGWTLGQSPRGGGYFNRVEAIDLNASQEAVVLEAAKNSYRPCCNNSTFFQDCNHGSALLGLYELAASQGASIDDLYTIGRIANGYWYPDEYVEMAYFFKQLQQKSWDQLEAATILDKKLSSFSGWRENVHRPLVNAGLLPNAQFGNKSNCGV